MGKKFASKKDSNTNQTNALKSANEEGGSDASAAATTNSAGNLKSFEHLLETVIETQNQFRDDQDKHFAQQKKQLENYHNLKSTACDCVFIPWSDLKLLKIARDEPNPVQSIMQMFADFQINQRKLTERVIELEAANKALTALQNEREIQNGLIIQKANETEILRGEFEKQNDLLNKKDTEIGLLMQQHADDMRKLDGLTIKIEAKEETLKKTNDLLAQIRKIGRKYRDEANAFQTQISVMKSEIEKLQSELETTKLKRSTDDCAPDASQFAFSPAHIWHIISQKDKEIELLKQHYAALSLKMGEREWTQEKTNDLLSQTRQLGRKYRDEAVDLRAQVSAMKKSAMQMRQ